MSNKLFASLEERQRIAEQELDKKPAYISEAKYVKLKNSVRSSGELTLYIGGVAQFLVLVLYLYLGMSVLNAFILGMMILTFSFLGWKIKQLKAKNIDSLMYSTTIATGCVIFLNVALSNNGEGGSGILVWIMFIKQIIGCVSVSKLIKIQEFRESLI